MGKNKKAQIYLDIVALHNEVTGSCLLCTLRFPDEKKVKFIVDCGLFQEEEYNNLNYDLPFDPSEYSFILVTHTHIDHIGRIPQLYKKGFNGKIYATQRACELMPVALYNTAEILSAASQKNLRKKQIVDSSIPLYDSNKPIYDSEDVDEAMRYLVPVNINKTFNVDDHIAITFLGNGHTFGSASITVTASYKKQQTFSVTFSGDYSPSNMFFDTPEIPNKIKDTPMNVVIESTYGSTSLNSIEHKFRDIVIDSIKKRETLIITVFAFERMQHIMYEIKMLQEEGKISKNIPVICDGKLSYSYNEIFSKHMDELKIDGFIPANTQFVTDFETREALLSNRQCKIILTTSGMGNYGPAQSYLPAYISRPKCTIIFGGYTAENTLGRKLQEVNEGESFEINGIMTTKKAKVYSINEFSSHGKKEELLDFILQFPKLKCVLINHGDKDVKEKFAKIIVNEINPKHVAILGPKYCIRVDSHGMVKSYSSKIPYNFDAGE